MDSRISKLYLLSKHKLLYVAAVVWAFAGVMLISKGLNNLIEQNSDLLIKISIAIVLGSLFYYVMFRKISLKHIVRIKTMSDERVPFYAFFNRRSYIMMIGMISLGIIMRKSGLVSMEYLAPFYLTMGLPLLISSIRFLHHAIKNEKI